MPPWCSCVDDHEGESLLLQICANCGLWMMNSRFQLHMDVQSPIPRSLMFRVVAIEQQSGVGVLIVLVVQYRVESQHPTLICVVIAKLYWVQVHTKVVEMRHNQSQNTPPRMSPCSSWILVLQYVCFKAGGD